MADPKKTDVNLAPLYTELNRIGNNGDYRRAIKVANKSEWNCLTIQIVSSSFILTESSLRLFRTPNDSHDLFTVFPVLQEAPNEVNAQKYLVVCYIQESEFASALELINKNATLDE